MQSIAGSAQKMVKFKSPAGRRGCREDADHDGDENGVHDEQNYVQALGADNAEGECRAGVQINFQVEPQ